MKQSYRYPGDYEDNLKMSCHSHMGSEDQKLDEARYEVINSLMSVCQVIGLQILRKSGADDSLTQAAKHIEKAQALIADGIKHINKDYKK